jgi:hypothetical protein
MDLIADTLEKNAGPDDLIVVSPFYMLVGWGYHNRKIATRWTSLPPIPPDETSRPFPHMKAAMASENPIAPVLDAVTATLKAGKRVWLVGQFSFTLPDKPRPPLSRAPNPRYGWMFGPYARSWSMELGHLMQSHVTGGGRVPINRSIQVNPLENVDLIMASGWK